MTHFIFPYIDDNETDSNRSALQILMGATTDKIKTFDYPVRNFYCNTSIIEELVWRVATFEFDRDIVVISIPKGHIDESKHLSKLPSSCLGTVSSSVHKQLLICRSLNPI